MYSEVDEETDSADDLGGLKIVYPNADCGIMSDSERIPSTASFSQNPPIMVPISNPMPEQDCFENLPF